MSKIFDLEAYKKTASDLISEGAVLLKNDRDTLPLKKGTRIALFGRAQMNYYKTGTGSGSMVNTTYTTGVREALLNCPDVTLYAPLLRAYEDFVAGNPFDPGFGWGNEPWFQREMPVTEEMVSEARKETDTAIFIIGRTAGEDQDNKETPGSFLLTEDERNILKLVTRYYTNSIVLLNVGNIIDMNFVTEYDPAAVMYIWHGGQEGGNGIARLLTGETTPSGKLSDSIAWNISDYPAYSNFGDPDRNLYQEDIYVGYRYFTTFAKDAMQYPFGFGLSYTSFSVDRLSLSGAHALQSTSSLAVSGSVENTGSVSGKESVQIYISAPQGLLGKPRIQLVGFTKTAVLTPGEIEDISVSFCPADFASFDDAGLTGHKDCFVLEAGTYTVYAGQSSVDLMEAGNFTLSETIVISEHEEALNPVISFHRLVPGKEISGQFEKAYTVAPLRTVDSMKRRLSRLPKEIPFTGDLGIRLPDVVSGKNSLEEFVAQIPAEQLIELTRGEGMSSPQVTPGTGGAYGGVTKELQAFGIPVCCCTDGPSGIRMDSGATAFSLPNNTLMACSFNAPLVEKLFEFEGIEMRMNGIEALLGPGMNLHRYPLNGRNFEYFSEDPILTGKLAAAQLRGMHKSHVTGVIKHFFANNQEYRRNFAESVLSARAIRELYLKSFEIAVKEGNAYEVMTTYGPVNGTWTAGSYDLVTTILRNDWGFHGVVMTDWWAQLNDPQIPGEEAPCRENSAAMVRAQNDLYMVMLDAKQNSGNDNLAEAYRLGRVSLAELQRVAMNIIGVTMNTQAYDRMHGGLNEFDRALQEEKRQSDSYMGEVTQFKIDDEIFIPESLIRTGKAETSVLQVVGHCPAIFTLELDARCVLDNPLAQVSLSVLRESSGILTITLSGEDHDWKHYTVDLEKILHPNFFLKFYTNLAGLELRNIHFFVKEDLTGKL